MIVRKRHAVISFLAAAALADHRLSFHDEPGIAKPGVSITRLSRAVRQTKRQVDLLKTPARVALDRVDLRMLAALQRNGRISKVELAELVNLSPSACLERMRRLEKQKLIVSYHATLNLSAFMPIQMFLTEITLGGHRAVDFWKFERAIEKIPQVIECHALGGGIDYLVKIVASDVPAYQMLVDDLLSQEIGIERYFTYVVTKAVKSVPQFLLQA
jgi:Lrp/AsnC family transcriptional regulator, regulator of ectoine-degradation genes